MTPEQHEAMQIVDDELRADGPIRWWYDRTPDRSLTSDPEGELVALCDRCAAGQRVAWAADDADLSACELCGVEL